MDEPPYLSLIIPAHNEANRLPTALEQACDYLDRQAYTSEVIVVENASNDGTLQIARDFAGRSKRIRVLEETRPGKGRAVRLGMLAARGRYRFMADADFSMPVEEIGRFLPPHIEGSDIVLGSREEPGAVRYGEPEYRHLGGRLVNLMIRLLALPGLHDTQCGFKLFRAEAAELLFRKQTLDSWSFDIEILFIARRLGLGMVEIPIPWYYHAESKVRPVQDAARMFSDILRIRRNARLGMYT